MLDSLQGRGVPSDLVNGVEMCIYCRLERANERNERFERLGQST